MRGREVRLTDIHKLSRVVDAELASLVDQCDVHLSRTWALRCPHGDGVGTQKLQKFKCRDGDTQLSTETQHPGGGYCIRQPFTSSNGIVCASN